MGTPGFATEPLKALMDAGYSVEAVVTAPDKPSGRGLHLSESEVKRFATERGLKIMQPVSLKDHGFLEELKSLNADLFIVVAFRMLPREVWSMPVKGCFNLHASLLPQYRGAAPINHAIINGENITGVTTFFLDDKIDTGEIIMQEQCTIEDDDNAGTLHDKLMYLGANLVVKTADAIFSNSVIPFPQKDSGNTLLPAPKLNRETGRIDWSKGRVEIYNLIRGLSPYPGAYTYMNCSGKEIQIKIYESQLAHLPYSGPVGSIVKESKHSFLIACSDGYLRITDLQPAGKRRMKASEFLAGIRELENCTVK